MIIIEVIHNLSSCEIKAWQKIQVWMGFETTTCVTPAELTKQLGAGHIVSL